MEQTYFSKKVLTWFDKSGRHDLPWQKKPTPYRVWISEIMLQQTQVTTVIPYYEKFMARFPTIGALANAPLDEVLQYWSGLGYYARARNLHRTAIKIQQDYQECFPKTVEKLEALPGIGRSTAGAILSLGYNSFAAILDGNVKRVLSRCFAIGGSPSSASTLKKLWQLSLDLTPQKRCRDYNQAMMDLGALICTRTKPKCQSCPLQNDCLAHKEGSEECFPTKKASIKKPQKQIYLLLLKNPNGEILLQKRPPIGIWGGLWSLPECSNLEELAKLCQFHFCCQIIKQELLAPFKHVFTHFTLTIRPIYLHVKFIRRKRMMDSANQVWYNQTQQLPGGIPAPIARLLELKIV